MQKDYIEWKKIEYKAKRIKEELKEKLKKVLKGKAEKKREEIINGKKIMKQQNRRILRMNGNSKYMKRKRENLKMEQRK